MIITFATNFAYLNAIQHKVVKRFVAQDKSIVRSNANKNFNSPNYFVSGNENVSGRIAVIRGEAPKYF